MRRIPLLVLFLFLLATACADSQGSDPAPTVERYLQAKVDQDAKTIRRLLCPKMEADWEREVHTFEAVNGVTIQGMICQRRDQSDVVQCQGIIVAVYGGEQREFPLGSYRVVQEDGEWKWCGETR